MYINIIAHTQLMKRKKFEPGALETDVSILRIATLTHMHYTTTVEPLNADSFGTKQNCPDYRGV